ncbi:hypothetical protein QC761_504318 [Podospora bellae-mahoneyi]|uniref:Uncharacterized protein n=1 Tax=Podospora bellae-mahoneyi TaxID=2093777 RepID=A0ABR0FD01_9PEZI|nr:hypothetical protein QC761_504318 [Podospora bellae-mahoneyi]
MRFDAELGVPSVFKGQPREELDDMWDSPVDQPMILVNNETLQAFDPTSKPTKSANGHYYAPVEVFSSAPLLEYITRKFIWRNHYQHVDTFQDPLEITWEHVDRCIELLHQVLMCHADTGLIFYTDHGDAQPEAGVSTVHMCRNFSRIVNGVNEHDSLLEIFAEIL